MDFEQAISQDEMNKIYQKVGEFVVSYQWVEHLLRQIGWFIDDPDRIAWPPRKYRSETNHELSKKIESVYCKLMSNLGTDHSFSLMVDFKEIIRALNKIRRYRNNLLHSIYIEIKGGGEIYGLLRSNPNIIVDKNNKKSKIESEEFTAESIEIVMIELAQLAFKLSRHYVQLTHTPNIKKSNF